MRINKWSATVAAVTVLLAGAVSAEPGRGQAGDRAGAERVQKAEQVKQREGEAKDVADTERNETAREMQDRKSERKAIKEEYREAREAGDVEPAGKKPWWKFWGADDAS